MPRKENKNDGNADLRSLITLLDDSDTEVYEHVVQKLLSMGPEVIPSLEHAWGNSFDPTLQQRIEGVIHRIQLETLTRELRDWASSAPDDLLTGALLVARYQYPDLDTAKVKKALKKIKQDIWLELNDDLTPVEKIHIFNHILYELGGFSGNTSNILDPQNSFLNTVIETKKGTPVSLGVLYIIIARQLGLPVYGVDLPQHFILAFVDTDDKVMPHAFYSDEEILADGSKISFYINPFNKGAIFSVKEIYAYLKKLDLDPMQPGKKPNRQYFQPCSGLQIVRLMIKQLIYSYEELGYKEKVKEVTGLLNVLND